MARKDDMQDEAEEEGKRCKACACSCKSKKSGDWRAWFGKKTQSGACFGLAKTTKNNGPGPIERMLIPAKNGIFEPFIYKNDDFAKTGSGQT